MQNAPSEQGRQRAEKPTSTPYTVSDADAMLTLAEKLLFLAAVVVSFYLSYLRFRQLYLVVRRGAGEFPSRGELVGRLAHAAGRWLTFGNLWKSRGRAGVFHALIAWGFVFYLLVNFGDLLQGYLPVRFLGENPVGAVYRFLADVVTVAILTGMVYFLLRRFVVHTPALGYHDNVKLVEEVKAGGIRRDSLVVGLFILLHVGFRLLGGSFTIALTRQLTDLGDPAQPFANGVSLIWGGMSASSLTVGQHLGWWGRSRSGAGLSALLPAHQTPAPDHVRRQLPGAASTHLVGRTASARFRG